MWFDAWIKKKPCKKTRTTLMQTISESLIELESENGTAYLEIHSDGMYRMVDGNGKSEGYKNIEEFQRALP